MRLVLLLALLLGSSACVIERGARKPLELKTLSTRCEPGPVSATLDPAVRDRVRLVFSANERCEERLEQVYEVEHQSRIPVWMRVVLSVPAAAVVGGPIAIGLFALNDRPGVQISGGGEALMWAVIGPALLAGGGAFAMMSATQHGTTVESEQSSRTATRAVSRAPLKGMVTWEGSAGAPRELVDGALSLTLPEAAGLESAALLLDGAPVLLSSEAQDRLGFLDACLDAVRDFHLRAAEESLTARLARVKRAEVCEWNGWAFAEVERVLTFARNPAPSSRVTPQ